MAENFQFFFRSNHFKIVEGEEEETNPGCIGKELAEWLRDGFAKTGYHQASVVPEDWGWCLLLNKKGPLKWIGCGARLTTEDSISNPGDIIWTAFAEVEILFFQFKSLVSRMLGTFNVAQEKQKLADELSAILSQADFIEFCEETSVA